MQTWVKRGAISGTVGALTLAMMTLVAVSESQAEGLNYERLAGPSGVETSLVVAKHTWGTNWPVVYVAANRNPVDALPAATIGDGPVVLTDGKQLNLGGVKPGHIVILGGPGAVPDAVLQTVANGAATQRFAGANRYLTAFEIAKFAATDPARTVTYVASGTALKDAMVAGASKDGFILLTPPVVEVLSSKSCLWALTRLYLSEEMACCLRAL
ncbi:cell wall-binding repeat-containing protein [Mobiluncus sp.]|uniref:cell wall-binding repeat-containing protein n=1 Tax=Mobiluncus sp. TaxID=47293 RepID=UPI002A90D4E1|nr:cell wall-binding repeat-containing protein [Mobiluncus sp.]MDY6077190.1 cell wall-binding repeat-containing protein [Mobiluncus sp.]